MYNNSAHMAQSQGGHLFLCHVIFDQLVVNVIYVAPVHERGSSESTLTQSRKNGLQAFVETRQREAELFMAQSY